MMRINFDLDTFINENIIRRSNSMFSDDLDKFQKELQNSIQGKSILVIGGAGTIGSSFIKSVLTFKPAKLTVVDYSENGLTELTRDLRSSMNEFIPQHYVTYPFDFGSSIFAKLYKSEHFDIVACFAAHKHVRSEKDHLAIEAMINNNLVNTCKLLELCRFKPPEHFFSVSTDKAANPVNVMGASKKLMENALLAYANDFKISTARFANVAFSNGSLLDGFNYRMSKRQPLSSPADVKRYFVSPEESGQLCMLACVLGKSGDIFFPKLEERQMLTFSSIAEAYLKTMGWVPEMCETESEARDKAKDITNSSISYPVYFFKSETSGEKMYEEFFTKNDNVDANRFNSLGVINNPIINTKEQIQKLLQEVDDLFNKETLKKSNVIEFLNAHLSGFNHIETGKNLDQKM